MAWHARIFAEKQTQLGRKAYFYVFTHEPPHEPGVPNLRATHAAEMVYVFNNLHAPRMIPDRSSPKLAMESARGREVADQMSSYWVNFARTGDPNGRNLPKWDRFKDRNAPPHVIGEIREYPSADVLNKLDDQGNTFVVNEHNLDDIRCADHVIDLGPEGGTGGGRDIATGTPSQHASRARICPPRSLGLPGGLGCPSSQDLRSL